MTVSSYLNPKCGNPGCGMAFVSLLAWHAAIHTDRDMIQDAEHRPTSQQPAATARCWDLGASMHHAELTRQQGS